MANVMVILFLFPFFFIFFCMFKYERAKFFLDKLTNFFEEKKTKTKKKKKKKKEEEKEIMQSSRTHTHLPIYNES